MQRHDGTPDRNPGDALLEISEEENREELAPPEYRGSSGWEEAVRGWSRVAPMSCLFLSHKPQTKPKHKDGNDPTLPGAESTASITKQDRGSDAGPPSWSKKPTVLSHQETGSQREAAAAVHSAETEWTCPSAGWKTQSQLSLEGKIFKEESPSQPHHIPFKHSGSEHRPTRPRSKLVPIKNVTFLAPIKSSQLSPRFDVRVAGDRKPSHEKVSYKRGFTLEKKSGTRAFPAADPEFLTYSTALMSTHPTCQRHLSLYRVPTSSEPDTPLEALHRNHFSMDNSLTPVHRPSAQLLQ